MKTLYQLTILHLGIQVILQPYLVHGVGFEDETKGAFGRVGGGGTYCYTSPDCGQINQHSDWNQGMCKTGRKQSPLNFNSSAVLPVSEKAVKFGGNYKWTTFTMSNTGTSVKLRPSPDSDTSLSWPDVFSAPGTYKLGQVHFHWGPYDDFGSEHAIDQRGFSMKMHMVHYRSDATGIDEALTAPDAADKTGHHPNALAVVSVLLQVDNNAKDDLLKDIAEKAATVRDPEEVTITFNMQQFPNKSTKAYHYMGSLTTPPCNENVAWLVLQTPVFIKPTIVEQFRKVKDKSDPDPKPLTMNFRALQKMGDRVPVLVNIGF